MNENAVGICSDGEDGGFSGEDGKGVDQVSFVAVIQNILFRRIVDLLFKTPRSSAGGRNKRRMEMGAGKWVVGRSWHGDGDKKGEGKVEMGYTQGISRGAGQGKGERREEVIINRMPNVIKTATQ